MIGTTVAGLQLLSQSGATRVGDLFIGSCPDGRAAVKILRPEVTGDRARVDQAFAIAKKVGELDHRGIEFVIEASWDGDKAYLLGDIVPGATVQYLLDKGQFRDNMVASFVRLTADALAAAHALGVYHHALEPLLLHVGFASDRVLVRDFGLASLSIADEARAYRAPELDTDPPVADGSADVYSLGKIGKISLISKIGSFGSESETEDDELRSLFDRMTDSDPAKRPTAAEVRDQLAKSKPEIPSVVASSTPVNSKPSERPAAEPRAARAAWKCGECDGLNGAEHIFCLQCSAPMTRGIPVITKDIATLMSSLAGDFTDEITPPPGPPPSKE